MTKAEPSLPLDCAALKSGGIIMQKDDDFFSLRLNFPGGRVSAEKLSRIHEVADEYGRGQIRLTAGQGIKIPWTELGEIEAARRERFYDLIHRVGLDRFKAQILLGRNLYFNGKYEERCP